MKTVNGYIHNDEWVAGGNGSFVKATNNKEEYFLKRFQEPKYPPDTMPDNVKKIKIEICQKWLENRKAVNAALRKISTGNGNIVTPLEIFLDGSYYCQASYWVDMSSVPLDRISDFDEKSKLLLLKTLAASMRKVHSVNIVHGDLKPDNILIVEGKNGLIAKVIDFDDSYFAENPPLPEDTVGTECYWSPELAYYKISQDEKFAKNITCKSDVYALGIIFHQYLAKGRLPAMDKGCINPYQMSGKGKNLKAEASIRPLYLQKIINQMLKSQPGQRPSMEQVQQMLKEPDSIPELTRKLSEEEEPEVCQYTITAKSNLPEAGKTYVNKNEKEVCVEPGERVNFEATENAGYRFLYWKIAGRDVKQKKFSVKAVADLEAEACFERVIQEKFTISGNCIGGGRLLINGREGSCTVPKGEKVQVEAVADSGYKFSGMDVAGNRINAEKARFKAVADILVKAEFSKREINIGPGGLEYEWINSSKVRVTLKSGRTQTLDAYLAREMGMIN